MCTHCLYRTCTSCAICASLARRDRSTSASRSVHLRAEIGPLPARDRSTSASRSAHLRAEIGPLPARDRSTSAPRSAHLRAEIGPPPPRDRSQPTTEHQQAATTPPHNTVEQKHTGSRPDSPPNISTERKNQQKTIRKICDDFTVFHHSTNTAAIQASSPAHPKSDSSERRPPRSARQRPGRTIAAKLRTKTNRSRGGVRPISARRPVEPH